MTQKKELTQFLLNLNKGDFAEANKHLSYAIENKIKERMSLIMKEQSINKNK